MASLLVINVVCGGPFADDIVLCAQLKKLLKFDSKWARNN